MPVPEENSNLEKKAPFWPSLKFYPAEGGWHPDILSSLRDDHYHFQLLRPRADGRAPLARILIGVTDDAEKGGANLAVGVPISDSSRGQLLSALNLIFNNYFPSPGRHISVHLYPLECKLPVNDAGLIAVIPVDIGGKTATRKADQRHMQLAQYIGENEKLLEATADNNFWVLVLPPDSAPEGAHLVPPDALEFVRLYVLDVRFEATDTPAPLVLSRSNSDAICVPVLWGPSLNLVRLNPIQLWAFYRSRAFSRAALWQHCSNRRFLLVVLRASGDRVAGAVAAPEGSTAKSVEPADFAVLAERYARGKPLLLVALDTLSGARELVAGVRQHSQSFVWIVLVCTTPKLCFTLMEELSAASWSELGNTWRLLDVVLSPEAAIKPLLELQAGGTLKLPPIRPYFAASASAQPLGEMEVVSMPYGWVVNFELAKAMSSPPGDLQADVVAFLKNGAGRPNALPLALMERLPKMVDVDRLVCHVDHVLNQRSGGADVSLLQLFGQGGATTILWQASMELAKSAWVVLLKKEPVSAIAELASQLLRLAQGAAMPIVVVCDDHISLPPEARGAFLRRLYEAGYGDVPVVVVRTARWWPGDSSVPAKVDLVLSPFLTADTVQSLTVFLLEVAFADAATLESRRRATEALVAAKGRVHVLELVHCAAGQKGVADVARILQKLDKSSRRALLAVAALTFCGRGPRPLPLPALCKAEALSPAADLFEVCPKGEEGVWITLRPYWALSLLVAGTAATVVQGEVTFLGGEMLELVEIGFGALADKRAVPQMKQLVRGRRLPRWIELLQDKQRRITKEDRDLVVALIEKINVNVAQMERNERLLKKSGPVVPLIKTQIALLVLASNLHRKVQTALRGKITEKILQKDSLERTEKCMTFAKKALELENTIGGGFTAAETEAYARLNMGLQANVGNAAELVQGGFETLLKLMRRQLDDSHSTFQKLRTCSRLLSQLEAWLGRLEEKQPSAMQRVQLQNLMATVSNYGTELETKRQALQPGDGASEADSGVLSPPPLLAGLDGDEGEDEDVDGVDDIENVRPSLGEGAMVGSDRWVPIEAAEQALQQAHFLAHCFEMSPQEVVVDEDDEGWTTV